MSPFIPRDITLSLAGSRSSSRCHAISCLQIVKYVLSTIEGSNYDLLLINNFLSFYVLPRNLLNPCSLGSKLKATRLPFQHLIGMAHNQMIVHNYQNLHRKETFFLVLFFFFQVEELCFKYRRRFELMILQGVA